MPLRFVWVFVKSGFGEHGLTSWILLELTTENTEKIEIITT